MRSGSTTECGTDRPGPATSQEEGQRSISKDVTFRIATGIPSEGGGYERYAFPNGYSTQHLINPQPEAAPMAAAVLLAAGVAGLSVDGT